MKVERGAVDGFLRRPDPARPIVLLHGPDGGVIRDRALALARSVVDDPSDPFRVSELSEDALAEAPERLALEAQSLCLLGGRRLVRVRQAGEGCRRALEQLLAIDPIEALVVIEADEQDSRSKLRQLAEKSPRIATIACWRDEDAGLRSSIRGMLAELGLRTTDEARQYLETHLGADRALTRSEIEKLALHHGDEPSPVTLAEAAALIGDGSALAIDDAVDAMLAGRASDLDDALIRLAASGTSPIRLLRAAAMRLSALLRIKARMAQGMAAEAAMNALRPPPPWPVRARLQAALAKHSSERLASWLRLLQTAEIRCKSAKAPDTMICARALAAICEKAGATRAGPRISAVHPAQAMHPSGTSRG